MVVSGVPLPVEEYKANIISWTYDLVLFECRLLLYYLLRAALLSLLPDGVYDRHGL